MVCAQFTVIVFLSRVSPFVVYNQRERGKLCDAFYCVVCDVPAARPLTATRHNGVVHIGRVSRSKTLRLRWLWMTPLWCPFSFGFRLPYRNVLVRRPIGIHLSFAVPDLGNMAVRSDVTTRRPVRRSVTVVWLRPSAHGGTETKLIFQLLISWNLSNSYTPRIWYIFCIFCLYSGMFNFETYRRHW